MADLEVLLRGAVDRLDITHEEQPADSRRTAGVLLLFDTRDPRLPLLFIERAADLRHHPGQIGFPGGGSESGDADIVATALREAREEAAIPTAAVEVIGLLPPLLTATSDNWLTPVVGVRDGDIEMRPDGVEVARLFHLDLQALIDAPHTVRTLTYQGRSRDVHFYDAGGEVVWGVTAAIVAELIRRISAAANAAEVSGSGGAR